MAPAPGLPSGRTSRENAEWHPRTRLCFMELPTSRGPVATSRAVRVDERGSTRSSPSEAGTYPADNGAPRPPTPFRKHDSWNFHPHPSHAAHLPCLRKVVIRGTEEPLEPGLRNATFPCALPVRRLDGWDIVLACRPVAFYRRDEDVVFIRSLIFCPRPHGIVDTRPVMQSPRRHQQTTLCPFAP
jgi:hypothetical protein